MDALASEEREYIEEMVAELCLDPKPLQAVELGDGKWAITLIPNTIVYTWDWTTRSLIVTNVEPTSDL